MFIALVLTCGLHQSVFTPEGCSLKAYKNPFTSKVECDWVVRELEYNASGSLPKGAYIVDAKCVTLGTSS